MADENAKHAPPFARQAIIIVFNVALAVFCLLGFWLLPCFPKQNCEVGPAHYRSAIAALAIALGSFVGFLYATFGAETEKFKNISTLTNGFIGGFAITDLMKKDSAILRILHTLARAAGDGQEVGGVAAVLGMFGVMGFLCGYVNKTLWLNEATADALSSLDHTTQTKLNEGAVAKGQEVANRQMQNSPSEERKAASVPTVTKEEKALVARALKFSKLTSELTPEELKAMANAYMIGGQYTKAEELFENYLALSPQDSAAWLNLAQVRIALGRQSRAIEPLERYHTLVPGDDTGLKLLGYVYLWDPGRIDDSIRMTEEFLVRHPDHGGASLNLACAYAQKGKDGTNRAKVLKLVEEVIKVNPKAKQTIKELLEPPGDFKDWKGDTDLAKLIT